jgi:hypothetical protein
MFFEPRAVMGFSFPHETPFPLKWEILLILGIFAVFEKYIF